MHVTHFMSYASGSVSKTQSIVPTTDQNFHSQLPWEIQITLFYATAVT